MRQEPLSINYIDKNTQHAFHLPVSSFKRPTNRREYKKLEALLDDLIEEVRGNENHPLATVMQIIGNNLEHYDDKHHIPIGKAVSHVEMVEYLLKSYELQQKDLASIFGGQGNVSNFLHGKRALNTKQIEGIKRRFGISADFFI